MKELRKHFEPNEIVYFLVGNNVDGYSVKYGIVFDEFTDGVMIDCLELKDCRLINGIPYKDFEFPSKWKKLPKNWTYNTKLFDLDYDDSLNEYIKGVSVKDKDAILRLYNNGILVKAETNDHNIIEAEIDKNFGWRIISKYPMWSRRPFIDITLPHTEVYRDYDSAYEKCKEIKKELDRQANLSDEEWSIEQIEKTLNRYNKINDDENYINKVRKYLYSLDNIEDVEVRIFNNIIQYKYWKNKKWKSLNIDTLFVTEYNYESK